MTRRSRTPDLTGTTSAERGVPLGRGQSPVAPVAPGAVLFVLARSNEG